MSAELRDIPELSLDDPWGIYYTGGTTGLPKGAVLTHGNVTWNSVNTIASWGINGQHKAALQLPFFHIGGPNIFMAPLVHAGGTTILCSGFDADETFDLVEHAGITHYVAVPTMFQMLQEHPRWEEADFSQLELVISGGAPCPLPSCRSSGTAASTSRWATDLPRHRATTSGCRPNWFRKRPVPSVIRSSIST